MKGDENSKEKLPILNLMVLEILARHSDEEHQLRQSDILRILKEDYGMICDRRHVPDRLRQLMMFGFDIRRVQHGGAYTTYYMGPDGIGGFAKKGGAAAASGKTAAAGLSAAKRSAAELSAAEEKTAVFSGEGAEEKPAGRTGKKEDKPDNARAQKKKEKTDSNGGLKDTKEEKERKKKKKGKKDKDKKKKDKDKGKKRKEDRK